MTTITVSTTVQLNNALKNAKGGEVIQLASGTYVGVALSDVNPESLVTIRSLDPNNQAVIANLQVTQSSNLRFDGLDFYADPSLDPHYAFRIARSNDLTFSNLNVHGTLNGTPGDDTAGFVFDDSSRIAIVNSQLQQLSYAVGFLNSEDILVQGNRFHDIRSDGVRFGGSSKIVVDRNSFTDFYPVGDDHPDAIQFWTVNTTESARDITITNNVFTRGNGEISQGIFFNDELGNRPYIDVTIDNNLMVGTMYHGITIKNAQNLKITNNEVHAYSDMKSWIDFSGVKNGEISGNKAFQFNDASNSGVVKKNNDVIGYITPAKVEALVAQWLAKIGDAPGVDPAPVEPPAPPPPPPPPPPVVEQPTTPPAPEPQPQPETPDVDETPIPPVAEVPPAVEPPAPPPPPPPPPVHVHEGTHGDDRIVLTGATAAAVYGHSGADVITTGSGNDWVSGGSGNDAISTGAGDDTIAFSGPNGGDDAIDGGAGYDRIVAQANGTVIGLSSLTGVELISAEGFQNVVIDGTGGNDRLDFSGVQLVDISLIDGGAGNDTIIGSAGNDTIAGNWGDDSLVGGAGDDVFLVQGNAGYDTIDGGSGRDTIRATSANTTIGWGKIAGIEVVDGGGFANVAIRGKLTDDKIDLTGITLTSIALIDGYNGNDTIIGSAGDDRIDGGYGDDKLSGGAGNDTFLVSGNAGRDTIDGGTGYDSILATSANTTISWGNISNIEKVDGGGFANVVIRGGLGNDLIDLSKISVQRIALIDGYNGNDTIIGSAGDDRIDGGFGDDKLSGGAGNDTFLMSGNAGRDTIDGGTGYDSIVATSANTTINGSNITNIEKIDGGGFANVVIKGGEGGDLIDLSKISLQGIRSIEGGSGNDTIIGSAGDDRIVGGYGADVLTGGGGRDVFVFNAAGETRSNGLFDVISDFKSGIDRIDLSALDANSSLRGDQAFRFLGKEAFSSPGDLRIDTTTIAGMTRILGDANGDRIAELEIRLTGHHSLTQADFIL